MSVSEATRLAKEALAHQDVQSILMGEGPRVPITGNYYDAIRAQYQVRTHAPSALTNQFSRGLFNKRGGVKSFAAADYNYPSQQMVIGAALAAAPDLRQAAMRQARAAQKRQAARAAAPAPAPAPAPSSSSSSSASSAPRSGYCAGGRACYCPDGSCNAACCPQAGDLAGYGRVFESPSESRKRQVARLMGLSGLEADAVAKINLATDVLGGDVDTYPDSKEDDVDNLFGGGRIVAENHTDADQVLNTKKVKVIRVVNALKANRVPVTPEALKFYGKAFLVNEYDSGVLSRPNLEKGKVMAEGAAPVPNRWDENELMRWFVGYAEPRRGKQSIESFQNGAFYSDVAKTLEEKFGELLNKLDAEFKARCGEMGEKCVPGYQEPSAQPPAQGGGTPMDFSFNRDFQFKPMPAFQLRKDILENIVKEKKKNGSSDVPPAAPEEKKPFPTAAVVGGLAVVGLVGFLLMKRRSA
jgi:hypothetical protein